MKLIYLFVLALVISFSTQAQNPKREFRAVWVATVSNIDWPSSSSLTPQQERDAFVTMLNQLQQTGINAVLVQIRSNCDAIYPSTIEPWASLLTGTQGVAPSPLYDPLQFMIDECRKRGMEFHAWFNPYRAVSNFNTIGTYSSTHIAVRRPDLLLSQGTLRILDPGKPEVVDYVLSVVMDVVRRYDIDGVHFDDYFYPYPPTAPTVAFDDAATYASFGRGIANVADWRRANVDSLIKRTNDSIKAAKPWVKFGISPFGIWRNGTSVGGSATTGLESFSAIFANSRLWQQQNWVDYQMPQIYWSIGFSAANYGVLVPWWNTNANNRHIYAGHGAYKINSPSNYGSDNTWTLPTTVPNQIRLNRNGSYPNVLGSCFFSTKSILDNPLGVRDSLTNTFFNTKALMPTMPWKDNVAPPAPVNVTAALTGTTIRLNWTRPTTANTELERARQYVVYRFTSATVDLNNAAAIRTITPVDTTNFTEIGLVTGTTYTYVVTALDRLHNESIVSNTVTVPVVLTAIQPLSVLIAEVKQNYPNPFAASTQIAYKLNKASFVTIKVFDIQGKEVAILFNGNRPIGNYTETFDATGLQAGVYTTVFSTKDGQKSFTMVKE